MTHTRHCDWGNHEAPNGDTKGWIKFIFEEVGPVHNEDGTVTLERSRGTEWICPACAEQPMEERYSWNDIVAGYIGNLETLEVLET